MNEHVIPLFHPREASPIIDEAIRIHAAFRLPERGPQHESGCFLGDAVGQLMNHEVIHLLETAVSRMIDNLPHAPEPQDFYVHHAIHHLYRTYTHRFLQGELQRDFQLEALLTRLIERNLWHQHNLAFSSMSPEQWNLMVDLGQVLLEREFPTGSNPGPLQNIAFSDYSKPHHSHWLREVWERMLEGTAA